MLTKQQKIGAATGGGCLLFILLFGCAGVVGAIAWSWIGSRSKIEDKPIAKVEQKPIAVEKPDQKPVEEKPINVDPVTRENYRKINDGMRFPDVEAVLGTGKEVSRKPSYSTSSGKMIGPVASQVQIYPATCVWNWHSNSGCSITIEFQMLAEGNQKSWFVHSKSIVGD